MSDRGSHPRQGSFDVVSVNISEAKGTAKQPVGSVEIEGQGLAGDAHRDVPGRGVSLLDAESIDAFRLETGVDVAPGAFGENLTTRGIDLGTILPGDLLEIAQCLLEVTAIGKSCHGDG